MTHKFIVVLVVLAISACAFVQAEQATAQSQVTVKQEGPKPQVSLETFIAFFNAAIATQPSSGASAPNSK